MSDVALTADDVAALLTYVVPGFLARQGYRTRFPGRDHPAGEVLIVSAVLSLPLVAFISAVLPGAQEPTQFGYVALLVVFSFGLGYLAAVARGTQRVKDFLSEKLKYQLVPEGSIYSQTLKHMSPTGQVTIELKDGRRVAGMPRNGPQYKDDGINELYLTNPKALGHDDVWVTVGEGLIIPLTEVSNILLDEEPTGA